MQKMNSRRGNPRRHAKRSGQPSEVRNTHALQRLEFSRKFGALAVQTPGLFPVFQEGRPGPPSVSSYISSNYGERLAEGFRLLGDE